MHPSPPLVAVPGLGLSGDAPWRALDRLTRNPVVVELPGYGRPARRGTSLRPPDLAGRLLAELDGRGIPRAVLLGHSASCQIVVEAAARAPERVAALVLVGPTTDPRATGWAALAARWLRTAAWERPWQVPVLVRDYTRTGLPSMVHGMGAARRHRIDHALAAVACPVLVVRGRRDRIAPRDWTAALVATAPPGSRAETLPAGAHMVPLTHPATLAARITGFLDALPPDARQDHPPRYTSCTCAAGVPHPTITRSDTPPSAPGRAAHGS